MLIAVWLGLKPCSAGPDALVPRVIKVCVPSAATIPEPRTATAAATCFAGFRDGSAFAAYGTGGRRRGC